MVAATTTSEAVALVTEAVQKRLTTPRRLSASVAARRWLPRRALLESLLGDVEAGAQSPLEVDFLHHVERRHGLPAGRRQARQRGTEVDVAYDAFATLVELDGRLGHTGAGRSRDMRRDNAALFDGLVTLRYGRGRRGRPAVRGRVRGRDPAAEPRLGRHRGALRLVPGRGEPLTEKA